MKLLSLVAFGVLIALLFAAPFMWLWNGCLVDAVTFAKPIGFWQAIGLLILLNLMNNGTSGSE